MACGELSRVNIKTVRQLSGFVMHLFDLCFWISSRYVIFMIPCFTTSISPTRQHTCSSAALCEISRFCHPSFLPTSTLHHSYGCVVYLFRKLGWNWASQTQRSCFKLLQFWLQFLHHRIQIWIGALLSNNMFSWLSYILRSDRKCSQGWT